MAKNVINVSDFYTKENEEGGKWFEAMVRGMGSGIEFKVYGPNSNPVTIARDKQSKAMEEASKIEDAKKRNEVTDEIMAQYATDIVADIRGKDGLKLENKDGTPVTVKDVKDIMINSPILALEVIRFASAQNNFLSA